jgi:hypothetical protein
VLVERDIADGLVLFHQRLRAVPVVHVPIDDEHAFPSCALGMACGDDRIGDETEAHRP